MSATSGSKPGTKLGPQVLHELAMLYFEIPLPRTTNANPFGDVMSSLFGGPPGSGSASAQPRTITPGAGRAQLTLD
jgi:hypothetical protein